MPGRAAARQDGKRQRGGRHGHAGREWRVAGGLAARVGQDCHGVRPLSVQDDDLVLYGRQVPDRGLVPVGRAAAVLLRVPAREWTGNGVLDRFLEDESLFGEFLRTPVSEGGVESLVVEPPHIVVEVGA